MRCLREPRSMLSGCGPPGPLGQRPGSRRRERWCVRVCSYHPLCLCTPTPPLSLSLAYCLNSNLWPYLESSSLGPPKVELWPLILPRLRGLVNVKCNHISSAKLKHLYKMYPRAHFKEIMLSIDHLKCDRYWIINSVLRIHVHSFKWLMA